jgi:predicted ATP-grasp superfamily ATP-dependent carboligase
MRVVLAGVSTRAAAESAARAGFAVTAVDAFADRDQHPSVRAQSLGARFSPAAAARAARTIECDAAAYLANFENYPNAVRRLGEGRALWGNAPEVIRRVRDPLLLSQTLRRRGLGAPDVSRESRREGTWLVKPLASGGGHRVRLWRPGMGMRRGSYLQEQIEGTPGSIVFVASHGRVVPLGVSRQLVGEEAFGAHRYCYCGNILVVGNDTTGEEVAACALAGAVCEAFGLVGVNGIDFVAKGGIPYAIEVNPRWCASMELVERAYGLSVFGAHAAACRDGVLPDFDLPRAWRSTETVGKAVVFARRDVMVGDTQAWLADSDVRDVPHPGMRILAGRPVCTVFASGRDVSECRARLVRKAERVYESLPGSLPRKAAR